MYFVAGHVSEHGFARFDKYNLNCTEVDCKAINDRQNYVCQVFRSCYGRGFKLDKSHSKPFIFNIIFFGFKFIEIIVFLFS